MQPARIAELLAPFLGDAHQLTSHDLDHISTYIDLLLRWNARINLTAVRDPDELVTRHFGESLFAARILFPKRNRVVRAALESPIRAQSTGSAEHGSAEKREGGFSRSGNALEQREAIASEHGRAALEGRVQDAKATGASAPGFSTSVPLVSPLADKITLADVGSGAGFPGIPIKLWHPALVLTLIESNQKKATFLREVARSLRLTEINILMARAETLSKTSFDVVSLRAVEVFEFILPIAAGLVSPGGRLALLIGSAQISHAESIIGHIHGFAADQLVAEPVPLSRARVVAVAKRIV
jgi:16S rRNA (guanine(527)-N(7))-methyltransferase RsmG